MTAHVSYSVESEKITEEKLNSLRPKQRRIIEMRLGMGEYKRQHTLKEISLDLNVTPENIRQNEAIALRRMRHPRFIKEEDIPLLERKLSTFSNLKPRLTNCLSAEGIECLNDLKEKRFESSGEIEIFLMRTPNLGRKSIMEFKSFLMAHNLSYASFLLTKEEIKDNEINKKFDEIKKQIASLDHHVIRRDLDDIKRVLNGQYHQLKAFEEKFRDSNNQVSDHCKHEIQTFKNEIAFVAQQIQRSINTKIMEFNEFASLERYKLEKLIYSHNMGRSS